jgi:hypothetical protein
MRRLIAAVLISVFSTVLIFTFFTCAVNAQVTAGWQQRNKNNPDLVNNLGAGNNVNPDPNSEVRVRVTGIPEGFVAKLVQLYEEDWSSPDDHEQDLTPRQMGNEASTDWVSPPMQTDDAGFHSEWYAIVTIGKSDCTGNYTIKTPVINVPDGVVQEDQERTSSESSVEVGGSVKTENGKIEAKKSEYSQRKRVVDYAATYKDPTITVTIVLLSTPPPDWSLSLDPSTFTIGPGQSKSVDLVFVVPSVGEVLFAVRSYSSPTGLIDETDPIILSVTDEVGGIIIPVDKFGLLAPYIVLASTILAATVASTIYVKRVKRRKEKQ